MRLRLSLALAIVATTALAGSGTVNYNSTGSASFGTITDGSSNNYSGVGLVDGSAAANRAQVFSNNALSVQPPSQYPNGSTPQQATNTGTTAATTATLAGVSSQYTFICGFSIRANATAATTGNATVTDGTWTQNYTQWTAPAANGLGILEEVFIPCIPGSGTNTGIGITSAAAGTGGVVSVTAWGYSKATSP